MAKRAQLEGGRPERAGNGEARMELVREALRRARLDALVCAFPSNVLMLTGYWPVVGTSVAVISQEGRAIAIVPEDEAELAAECWAEVRTFSPSSLKRLATASERVVEPLGQALRELGVDAKHIGYGDGPASQPASYSAMHIYGGGMGPALRKAAGAAARLSDAEQVIHQLRSVKTEYEIAGVRRACEAAGQAFAEGRRRLGAALASPPLLKSGLQEVEVAAIFRAPLSTTAPQQEERGDGFVFCMSGPNASQASGAYARSRRRQVRRGDLALVHCNSYVNGYWTDITRTYCIGVPDERKRELYGAVFAAREAALKAIRPGARARDVDAAARSVLEERGHGKEFKHSTGHGVGFGAIDANAIPRLHPKSPDVLEPGMVFNVEPAIYMEGYGGIRHCDVVAVSEAGAEVLTPFQANLTKLTLG